MDKFPLHRRVADELRARIATGTIPVGRPLPSENELMVEFGVSRGTVRQALAGLRADGTVAGGRGAPPVARGAGLAQPFSELISFSAWIGSLGRVPSGRLVGSVRGPVGPGEAAQALGLAPDAPVRRIVRVRYADDEPLMIERTTFPDEIGDLVARLDLERRSIYAGLAAQGIVVASAHQAVGAVVAGAEDARLLSVPARSPLLRVRRRSLDASGRPLEWSDDRYRAERVTFMIDNTPARPALGRALATGGA